MVIPFYKLQVCGNAFILVDSDRIKNLPLSAFGETSVRLCSRRYGVSASGCIFFNTQNNETRFFSHHGAENFEADDALLCVARYAFDSGRITLDKDGEKTVCIHTGHGKIQLPIIDSHNFQLTLGSPFSALSNHLLTRDSVDISQSIVIDGKKIYVSAIHLHDDVFVAVSHAQQHISLPEFNLRIQQQFPNRTIHPVFARSITRESISVKTLTRGMSLICSSACASLIASYANGTTDNSAIVVFDELQNDTDNSRKLTCLWNVEKNELSVIGSGGYVCEGKFDI